MPETFVDQIITAIDALYWVDDRSENIYLEHILPNIAAIDCVTEGSDY